MTGIPDPVEILKKKFNFLKKCLNNILVIKKEKKLKKCFFFWFMALKSYEAFF